MTMCGCRRVPSATDPGGFIPLGPVGELDDRHPGLIAATAEAISRTERRAMEAERETTDRYIAGDHGTVRD